MPFLDAVIPFLSPPSAPVAAGIPSVAVPAVPLAAGIPSVAAQAVQYQHVKQTEHEQPEMNKMYVR